MLDIHRRMITQQRCQYFQWLSKTNSKTCSSFNWPNRSEEAVRSGELDCIWNYGILLRYLQSLTFPFKFEKQPFGRKGPRMSPAACLDKYSKKQKLPTLVPEVLSVGEPKGLFWWCHYEFLEMGRKLSQFIDLACPDPGDFYFGWLASLCTEEAQKSMDSLWAH